MIIAVMCFLGGVIGAALAEFSVGWVDVSWWTGRESLNEDAIIYVVVGLAVGLAIGCLVELVVNNKNKS